MPFQRDTVPSWLKVACEPGEHEQDHQEMWANFLISGDLLYGLSGSQTNDKSGAEYYNAAQFARQFGMLQVIPMPPYSS